MTYDEFPFEYVKSDTTSDTRGHTSSPSFSRVESTKEQGSRAQVLGQVIHIRLAGNGTIHGFCPTDIDRRSTEP
jgi:hypothetical protein